MFNIIGLDPHDKRVVLATTNIIYRMERALAEIKKMTDYKVLENGFAAINYDPAEFDVQANSIERDLKNLKTMLGILSKAPSSEEEQMTELEIIARSNC